MKTLLALLCLGHCLMFDAGRDGRVQETATQEVETGTWNADLLDRIGFIGASASAGFATRVDYEFDGREMFNSMTLSEVFEVAAPDDDEGGTMVTDRSTASFFMSPVRNGRKMVDEILETRPTLVIGVDFLFWYTYGTRGADGRPLESEAGRLELLEKGLEQLDRFKCPVIVGDIPYMDDAVGLMLSRKQLPTMETIEAANKRIGEWVAARPGRMLFPLSALVGRIKSGEALRIGAHSWSIEQTGTLINADRLHPTASGVIAIAQKVGVVVDESIPADRSIPRMRDRFDLDHQVVTGRLSARKLEEKKRREALRKSLESKEPAGNPGQ
ncbi:MAG: hypothetical protein CMJ32_02670 [Phycisphaerae bacterium]|nr:hypothetical protein [Phycisphaerae bacterium]